MKEPDDSFGTTPRSQGPGEHCCGQSGAEAVHISSTVCVTYQVVAMGKSGCTSAPKAPVDSSWRSKGFAAPTDASRVKHGGPRMLLCCCLPGTDVDAVDRQMCSVIVDLTDLKWWGRGHRANDRILGGGGLLLLDVTYCCGRAVCILQCTLSLRWQFTASCPRSTAHSVHDHLSRDFATAEILAQAVCYCVYNPCCFALPHLLDLMMSMMSTQ